MLLRYTVPSVVTDLFIHCGYDAAICEVRNLSSGKCWGWMKNYDPDTASDYSGSMVPSKGISVWDEESVGLPVVAMISAGAQTTFTVKDTLLVNIAPGDKVRVAGIVYDKTDDTLSTIDETRMYDVTAVDQANKEISIELDTSTGFNKYAGSGAIVLAERADMSPVTLKVNHFWGVTIGSALQEAGDDIVIYVDRSTMGKRGGN